MAEDISPQQDSLEVQLIKSIRGDSNQSEVRFDVQKLLDLGADPNATSDDTNSALMWASYSDYPDIVIMLLLKGANIYYCNDRGMWSRFSMVSHFDIITLFFWIISSLFCYITRLYIYLIGQNALSWACIVGSIPAVRIILDYIHYYTKLSLSKIEKCNSDDVNSIKWSYQDIYSTKIEKLDHSTFSNDNHDENKKYHPAILSHILSMGSTSGLTPSHFAAMYNQKPTLDYLYHMGSSLDYCDIYGQTPLHHACKLNHIGIATYLLTRGCSPLCVDHLGNTPLHIAAVRGHNDLIKLLVTHYPICAGAIGVENKYGLTVLHALYYQPAPELQSSSLPSSSSSSSETSSHTTQTLDSLINVDDKDDLNDNTDDDSDNDDDHHTDILAELTDMSNDDSNHNRTDSDVDKNKAKYNKKNIMHELSNIRGDITLNAYNITQVTHKPAHKYLISPAKAQEAGLVQTNRRVPQLIINTLESASSRRLWPELSLTKSRNYILKTVPLLNSISKNMFDYNAISNVRSHHPRTAIGDDDSEVDDITVGLVPTASRASHPITTAPLSNDSSLDLVSLQSSSSSLAVLPSNLSSHPSRGRTPDDTDLSILSQSLPIALISTPVLPRYMNHGIGTALAKTLFYDWDDMQLTDWYLSHFMIVSIFGWIIYALFYLFPTARYADTLKFQLLAFRASLTTIEQQTANLPNDATLIPSYSGFGLEILREVTTSIILVIMGVATLITWAICHYSDPGVILSAPRAISNTQSSILRSYYSHLSSIIDMVKGRTISGQIIPTIQSVDHSSTIQRISLTNSLYGAGHGVEVTNTTQHQSHGARSVTMIGSGGDKHVLSTIYDSSIVKYDLNQNDISPIHPSIETIYPPVSHHSIIATTDTISPTSSRDFISLLFAYPSSAQSSSTTLPTCFLYRPSSDSQYHNVSNSSTDSFTIDIYSSKTSMNEILSSSSFYLSQYTDGSSSSCAFTTRIMSTSYNNYSYLDATSPSHRSDSAVLSSKLCYPGLRQPYGDFYPLPAQWLASSSLPPPAVNQTSQNSSLVLVYNAYSSRSLSPLNPAVAYPFFWHFNLLNYLPSFSPHTFDYDFSFNEYSIASIPTLTSTSYNDSTPLSEQLSSLPPWVTLPLTMEPIAAQYLDSNHFDSPSISSSSQFHSHETDLDDANPQTPLSLFSYGAVHPRLTPNTAPYICASRYVHLLSSGYVHTRVNELEKGYHTSPRRPIYDPTNKSPALCVACRIASPVLSRHCNQCRRCVHAMDHHCPLLHNCIGANNYRSFMLFCLLGSISSVSFLLTLFRHIYLCTAPVLETSAMLTALSKFITTMTQQQYNDKITAWISSAIISESISGAFKQYIADYFMNQYTPDTIYTTIVDTVHEGKYYGATPALIPLSAFSLLFFIIVAVHSAILTLFVTMLFVSHLTLIFTNHTTLSIESMSVLHSPLEEANTELALDQCNTNHISYDNDSNDSCAPKIQNIPFPSSLNVVFSVFDRIIIPWKLFFVGRMNYPVRFPIFYTQAWSPIDRSSNNNHHTIPIDDQYNDYNSFVQATNTPPVQTQQRTVHYTIAAMPMPRNVKRVRNMYLHPSRTSFDQDSLHEDDTLPATSTMSSPLSKYIKTVEAIERSWQNKYYSQLYRFLGVDRQ